MHETAVDNFGIEDALYEDGDKFHSFKRPMTSNGPHRASKLSFKIAERQSYKYTDKHLIARCP